MTQPHTPQSLAELPLKADVAAIATALGLSTAGSRSAIEARILEHNQTPGAEGGAAAEGADANGSGSESDGSGSESGSSEGDPYSESESTDASADAEEAETQMESGKLSPVAASLVSQLVASYMGEDEARTEIPSVIEALEAGKQPCIVEGRGNKRHEVAVVDQLFSRVDHASDASPGRDGVLMNIARQLENRGLYPAAN